MVTVFYGDNMGMSRKAFSEALNLVKVKGMEIVQLEGKKLDLNILTQALESNSLFGNEKSIFIDTLFSLTRSKEKDALIELVAKNIDKAVYVWEGKDLSKSAINLGKGFIFKQFKLPSVIFNFVDSLKPSNTTQSLNLFHQCLKTMEPEAIMPMIVRQIRLLILAKEGEQYLEGAPWMKSKIVSQSKDYASEKLNELYLKLLEIDYTSKTSGSALDLASQLDLWLTEI